MTARLAGRRGAASRVLGWLGLLLLPGVLPAQSAAPVDTLTREELLRTGRTALAEALQTLLPAFNFPRPSVAGGTDHVRPASWHGLGSDQLLVLVNGKRRLEHALVNVDATLGRGQGMVDLNAVPLVAIERIELYRTGNAARYGFGAVAGILDIILRADAGAELSAVSGITTAGDGAVLQAGGGERLRLGGGGSVRLSVEFERRGATNRALPDPRPQYFPGDPRNEDPAFRNRVTHRFGDPESSELAGVLNAARPIRDNLEVYGAASVRRRSGEAGERWRLPSDDRTVRALYPNGLLPILAPQLFEGFAGGGARGRLLGFRWDANLGYARNSIRYELEHTANASLGPQSPTAFDAGTLRADQFSVGVELVGRVRPLRFLSPLSLRFGAEHRSEGYQVEAGEPDSYRFGAVPIQDGPRAGAIAQPGAQGFAAFRPDNAVITRRGMLAAFTELSSVVGKRLSLAAGARVEYYRALGSLGAYQLSGGYRPLEAIELHAAYGTGVRIPSLSQSWFSSSSTTVLGQFALDDRTVPVRDPLATVLGARPLRSERSRNLSLGGRWYARGLTLSADYYRVRVNNRIILSGTFDDLAVQNFLAQQRFFGIGGVRFFGNALATRTTGLDAAAVYRFSVGDVALRLQGAFNHNTTRVTLTDSVPGFLARFTNVFFDRIERARIERGQPRDNLLLSAIGTRGVWTLVARSQRFGAVSSFGKPADGSLDQSYGAKWIHDLSVGYRRGRVTWLLGADNLFNTYPDRNKFGDVNSEGNSNFGMFPYSNLSPFGFNGRFLSLRATWR